MKAIKTAVTAIFVTGALTVSLPGMAANNSGYQKVDYRHTLGSDGADRFTCRQEARRGEPLSPFC
ncbi:hypothetical protein [Aliagarivorans marinus]|uniref:hypothetical protein n=1 Tax=Aliagarivorans marinus TaxID=561965 RepID=UPI0012FC367A|nr:hypothetical protein [Aliagarivorans marinus]